MTFGRCFTCSRLLGSSKYERLRQSHRPSVGQHFHIRGGRHLGQAGHGQDTAADHHHEARARADPQFIHRDPEITGPAPERGVVGERQRRLGHAHWQLAETVGVQQRQILPGALVEVDFFATVELSGERDDLGFQRIFELIKKMELAGLIAFSRAQDRLRKRARARAAQTVMIGDGGLHSLGLAERKDALNVFGPIIGEKVKAYDRLKAEEADVFDVFGQVPQPTLVRRRDRPPLSSSRRLTPPADKGRRCGT